MQTMEKPPPPGGMVKMIYQNWEFLIDVLGMSIYPKETNLKIESIDVLSLDTAVQGTEYGVMIKIGL